MQTGLHKAHARGDNAPQTENIRHRAKTTVRAAGKREQPYEQQAPEGEP
jgi:hypothetical protein